MLDESEPSRLRFGSVPVQIMQGENDATVFKAFTDQLNTKLGAGGNKVTYKVYPGVTHGGVVTAASKDADAFIKGRLK